MMKKFILDFLAFEERSANRTMELPSTRQHNDSYGRNFLHVLNYFFFNVNSRKFLSNVFIIKKYFAAEMAHMLHEVKRCRAYYGEKDAQKS